MVSVQSTPIAVAPPVARKSQIDSLHGLRFTAAFFILFMHASDWIAQFDNSDLIPRIASAPGVFGMPLFFVLSGFVIQYNYAPLFEGKPLGRALMEFAGARFARLYPLFIVFMISGMLFDRMIMWATNLRTDLFLYLLHNLTLTQAWFYVLANERLTINHGNALSWSISTEMFFYAAFPLIVLAISYLKSVRSSIVAWVVFALCAQFLFIEGTLWQGYLTYWFSLVSPQPLASGGDAFERFLFYFSPWTRVFEFALGCLTARIFTNLASREPSAREERWGRRALWCSLAVLLVLGWINYTVPVAHGAALYVSYFLVQHTFGSTIPIAVLIFCIARYRSWLSAIMASAAFVALGELSYSTYLIHAFVIRPYFITDPHPQSLNALTGTEALVKIAFTVVLTFVVSYGTYKVIEVPSRRAIRGWVAALVGRIYGSQATVVRSDGAVRAARLGRYAVIFAALLAACAAYQFVILRWIVHA